MGMQLVLAGEREYPKRFPQLPFEWPVCPSLCGSIGMNSAWRSSTGTSLRIRAHSFLGKQSNVSNWTDSQELWTSSSGHRQEEVRWRTTAFELKSGVIGTRLRAAWRRLSRAFVPVTRF